MRAKNPSNEARIGLEKTWASLRDNNCQFHAHTGNSLLSYICIVCQSREQVSLMRGILNSYVDGHSPLGNVKISGYAFYVKIYAFASIDLPYLIFQDCHICNSRVKSPMLGASNMCSAPIRGGAMV